MTASLTILGPSTSPAAAAPTKATGRSAARAKSAASGKASRSPASRRRACRAASGLGSNRQAQAGGARGKRKAHVNPVSAGSLPIFTELGDVAVLPGQMAKADLTFPAVMARHVAAQHAALRQADGEGPPLVARAGRPASVAPRTVAQEVIAGKAAAMDNDLPAAEKAAVLLMDTQPGRPAFSNVADSNAAETNPPTSPVPAASPEVVEARQAHLPASSAAGALPDQAPPASSTAQTSAVEPNMVNVAAVDQAAVAGHATPAADRADQAADLPGEPGELVRDPIAPLHTPAAARADQAASLPGEPADLPRHPIAPRQTPAATRADQAASPPDEPGELGRDPIAPRQATDAAADARVAGVQRTHVATNAEAVLPQTNVPDAATATDAAPATVNVLRVDGVELTFTRPASLTGQLRGAPARADRIIQQVSASLAASRARGNQEIVLRLRPPELGRIRLQLTSAGNELRAILEVDNARTFEEISRQAPALVQRLSDAGLQVKGIDVSLNDPSANEQQADGSDSTLRDPAHAGGRDGDGADERSETSTFDDGEDDLSAVFVQRVTDESIDVMM